MGDLLFDLPANGEGIQSMAVNWSPEQLFEHSFDVSAEEAVEEALWASKFQGTLSQRLSLAAELEHKVLRRLRDDEVFAADLTRGCDKKGDLRTLFNRWIKDAA